MSELKNCPFCGGEARDSCFPTDYPTEHCRAYVECTKCGAEMNRDGRVGNAKQLRENAIEAWNHRYTPEPHQLTLDELRQMDGQPVWIHWLNGLQNDKWIIWNKPWGGTIFDLDDPAVRYGETFIVFDRPPGGDRL